MDREELKEDVFDFISLQNQEFLARPFRDYDNTRKWLSLFIFFPLPKKTANVYRLKFTGDAVRLFLNWKKTQDPLDVKKW